MAIILFACTLLAGALAAPAISNGVDRNWKEELADNLELQRSYESMVSNGRSSGYGNVYMSPCAAAAASAPIQAYAPSAASAASLPVYASPSAVPYTYGHQTYQTVPAHKGHSPYYSYGHPYYRSEEEFDSDQDMLGFPDMNTLEHMPMARYSYGGAPIAQVGGGTSGGSQSSGPVVGVFSNANVGGYSLPLLVSCSPSIAQGRIVKAQPYHDGGSSQGSLYRIVNEQPRHVDPERHQEKTSSELLSNDSKSTNDKHQ